MVKERFDAKSVERISLDSHYQENYDVRKT